MGRDAPAGQQRAQLLLVARELLGGHVLELEAEHVHTLEQYQVQRNTREHFSEQSIRQVGGRFGKRQMKLLQPAAHVAGLQLLIAERGMRRYQQFGCVRQGCRSRIRGDESFKEFDPPVRRQHQRLPINFFQLVIVGRKRNDWLTL